jgi:hypothetical protein
MKLDWVSRHDPASLAYPIRTVARAQPRNVTWRVPLEPLNQGAEGACVGFGWTHEAMSTPVAIAGLDTAWARGLYWQAQKLDEWPGEDYSGSSVLAGAKAMQDVGYLVEYRWAFGAADVALGLASSGPVVLGIPWLSGMYQAPDGIMTPTGHIVGGHCILAYAYRTGTQSPFDEPAIGLYNSWGPGWGKSGRAWIRQSALDDLLKNDGEACVPYRRAWGKKQ